MTLREDLDTASAVAEGSTVALFRAGLIGIVPIIEFGALVAMTLLIVALPIKAIKKWVK